MSKFFKRAIGAGILAATFGAAAAAQGQGYGGTDYTVIQSHTGSIADMTVPDRALPPPGPGSNRAAAERWLRELPVNIDHYAVLLRDNNGNYAHCAGMEITLQTPRLWYQNLDIDTMAYTMDTLRLLRPEINAPVWPIRLGSCVPVDAPVDTLRDHTIGLKYGSTVEREITVPAYGPARTGAIDPSRSLSTRFQSDTCRNAGYNPEIPALAVGETIRLPALCRP